VGRDDGVNIQNYWVFGLCPSFIVFFSFWNTGQRCDLRRRKPFKKLEEFPNVCVLLLLQLLHALSLCPYCFTPGTQSVPSRMKGSSMARHMSDYTRRSLSMDTQDSVFGRVSEGNCSLRRTVAIQSLWRYRQTGCCSR
jgi:hypothetical protein